MDGHPPFFTVIIPIHNSEATVHLCLTSLYASTFQDWELVVVDDCSTDGSADIARQFEATQLTTNGRSGPAAARNLGATVANGHFLFFTDADCQFHTHTLSRAAHILQQNAPLDALIGSYDDAPAATNFISQYKNLFHHYTHQSSPAQATTFWTGCGTIKRSVFVQLGGFDNVRYAHPSIEDIELGYRLIARNGRIHLAKQVQVKHLKRWTLSTLLYSDIVRRALPWTRLLRQSNLPSNTLNLQISNRVTAFALLGLGGSTAVCKPIAKSRPLIPFFLIIILWLNAPFYRFLLQKRGLRFTLAAIPLHWLYYGYSTLTYFYGTFRT